MKLPKLLLILLSLAAAATALIQPVHFWALKENAGEETAADTGSSFTKARLYLQGTNAAFLGFPEYGVKLNGGAALLFPNGVQFAGRNGVTVAAWVRYDTFSSAGTIFAMARKTISAEVL